MGYLKAIAGQSLDEFAPERSLGWDAKKKERNLELGL
jgi:hypothetical protein